MSPERPRSPWRRSLPGAAAAALLAGTLLVPTAVSSASAQVVEGCDVPWADASATPDERATALIAASSQHQIYRWLGEQPATIPSQTEWRPGFEGEDPVVYPAQVECTPEIFYSDGPEAVRQAGVTDFPSQIALASTWDRDLSFQKGAAQAEEAFLKRRNVLLAPGVANGRTPLAGRTPEYYGEDALLNGLLGASGAEGIESSGKVLGQLKHFLANEQELDRQTSSSNIDERTLRQVYGLPYEIAAKRGAPGSIMCAFNQVNGVYICENPVQKQLLDDYGYQGFVMSDFGSVHSTAASLNNGLDQELNRPIYYTPARLDAALAAGEITQERIEEAAFKVIRSYIEAGLFDNPLPAEAVADASTPEREAIATRIATEGSVLLKNDRLLPLAPKAGQTIALFGPTASSTVTTVNGVPVSAVSVCSLSNSRGTNPPRNTLPCEDVVSAETALTARAEAAGVNVVWNDGQDVAAAAELARTADYAVVVGYQRMGEFSDIPDLRLQGTGDALIEAVEKANPRTAVVLQTGSAVEMPWLRGVQSVLETWYGGEQQGTAIAALLFGDANPSGKLPMTFPKSVADIPTSTPERYPGVFSDGSTTRPEGSSEIRQVEYSEGLQVGYKWYEEQGIDPLFAFGHGLSYTTFKYDTFRVKPIVTRAGKSISMSFTLTNTGTRAGSETAQLYVELPSSTGEPGKRLVGWETVDLAPKQSKRVTVTLSAKDLADLHLLEYWNPTTDQWTTARGIYKATVGGSSDTSRVFPFAILR